MPISTPILTTRGTVYDGSVITTAVDTGSASPSRVIVALCYGRDGNLVTGGTFAGVPATLHHASHDGSSALFAAILSASVPNGSGAQNCVLNFADWGAGNGHIFFYVFDGAEPTIADFEVLRTGSPPQAAVDVPAGGIVFGFTGSFFSGDCNNFNPSSEPIADISRAVAGGATLAGWALPAGTPVTVQPETGFFTAALSFAPEASAGGTYDEEIALSSGLGVSTAHNASLSAAVSMAAQMAATGSATAVYGGALDLGVGLHLTPEAQREITGALAFALSAALASDATLTIDQALALASSAGLASSASVTMEAAAALAVDLSAALNDALDGRTFDEALALGLSMLMAKAAQQDMSSTLDMGVQAGTSAASTATQGAEMALATALEASAGAALDIAAAMVLNVEAGMVLDGRRIVEGSISFPATFDSAVVAGAVLNGGLSFRAAFDQVATSILTADEAVALAIETTLGTGVITGNIVVGTVALDGTITRSVWIDGVHTDTSELTGTMDLIIRLNGRLN